MRRSVSLVAKNNTKQNTTKHIEFPNTMKRMHDFNMEKTAVSICNIAWIKLHTHTHTH